MMDFAAHRSTYPLGVVPTRSQMSIMRLQSSVVLFSFVTFSGNTKIILNTYYTEYQKLKETLKVLYNMCSLIMIVFKK